MRGRLRAARRRLHHWWLTRRMAGPRLIQAFGEAYPQATFAQIGANDGDQHDFLREQVVGRSWRGVLVEPVPYVFEALKANYEGVSGLQFENVAVGRHDGVQPFFHLAEVDDHREEGLPLWYHGLGSFSRDEVLSHGDSIPGIEARLVETEVPVLTPGTLLERCPFDHLDLLLIDTEGYDFEILKSADLDATRPRLIVYEHYHLSPSDREAAQSHLREHGYEVMEEHFDTFCLDARQTDQLTRLWRRLRPAVPGVAAYEDQ